MSSTVSRRSIAASKNQACANTKAHMAISGG
jgi:hypothetical protein